MIIGLFLLGVILGGIVALVKMFIGRARRRKMYRAALELQRRFDLYDLR